METSALSFARPALLNALWLLPLVVALFWWAEQRRRTLIARIVAPKLRAVLAGSTSPARRLFRGACVLLALGLLVVTLAGPRLGYDTLEVPHRGRDVIIAMDVSRSMLAPDVAPSRLQRAKLLAEDLIGELGSDRVGLVAFAGSAFLQAPLTLDHGAVLAALDELDTSVIPKEAPTSRPPSAWREEGLRQGGGLFQGAIIISDGEELDADGIAAARGAAENGIRIFTVGVGSAEGSEIPLGSGEFVRDPSGKVVQSRLDAARMTEIAEAGEGFYVPLDESAARRLSVDGIGKLAESDITMNSSRRPIERYQWLRVAIGLLVLQALGERRRRPAVAAGAGALAFLNPHGVGVPRRLVRLRAGNYEAARTAFEQRSRWSRMRRPSNSTPHGRLPPQGLQQGLEYFSRAMLAEDPGLRSAAEFNLGNTLFRQGEGQEDKAKRITDWKDAIAKYDAAMKTRPGYTEAKENKERVEKLLEELEKAAGRGATAGPETRPTNRTKIRSKAGPEPGPAAAIRRGSADQQRRAGQGQGGQRVRAGLRGGGQDQKQEQQGASPRTNSNKTKGDSKRNRKTRIRAAKGSNNRRTSRRKGRANSPRISKRTANPERRINSLRTARKSRKERNPNPKKGINKGRTNRNPNPAGTDVPQMPIRNPANAGSNRSRFRSSPGKRSRANSGEHSRTIRAKAPEMKPPPQAKPKRRKMAG